MTTALQPVASADGQAVDFVSAGCTVPVLRYAGLKAWDATSRVLLARLSLSGSMALALEVDDAGARYPLTIDPLTSTPINTLVDPAAANNNNFESSVAGADDVNGDGYGDLIIAAYGMANGGSYRGSIYVYYGSATGLGNSPGTSAGLRQTFTDPANADNNYFGGSVAGASDVNGDGYANLIVGTASTANGGNQRDSAYLFVGSTGALLASPSFSPADPANMDYDYFGLSVAGAGDVNGNDYGDFVVGAIGIANEGIFRGSAYVYYGNQGDARSGPWQYVVTQQLSTLNAMPLPVELSAFTATLVDAAAVRLAWATASEKNSARFEVERSTNGTAFDRLGTVVAAGTSSAPRAYGLLDSQLPAATGPTLYYRLRLVDLDGTASYSAVRSVTLTGTAGLVLFPNPAHTAATLTGTTPGTQIHVFDALGRVVATVTADANGIAALQLPPGLAVGVYVVRAGTAARRLVVE